MLIDRMTKVHAMLGLHGLFQDYSHLFKLYVDYYNVILDFIY